MTSTRARVGAAGVALVALALCLWRDQTWFEEAVVKHGAPRAFVTLDDLGCDPYGGSAIYHTPWNRLWPLLALNTLVIWTRGLLGHVLTFSVFGLIAWRYVLWGLEIEAVRNAVTSGACGTELWAGTLPAWQDVIVFFLLVGLLGWRVAMVAGSIRRSGPAGA